MTEYSEASEAIADDMAREQAKKSPSPIMGDTKPQADDATFRIIGDAGALFGALAAAQGSFLPITKNRTVQVRSDKGNYTFDYATLDQVLAATVPALSANGLALLQPFYHGPNGLELRTILAHSSGARLEAVTELPKKADTMQTAGSALTYLKRYQVQAILGVSSEEDDDGNAADGNTVQNMTPRDRSRPAAPPKPATAPATTPRKPPTMPQAAPPAQKAPSVPPPAKTAAEVNPEPHPAPTELLATADKLAEMKALLVALQFKGTPAKELIGLVTGKDHGSVNNADVDQVISVLQQAKDSGWEADRLMLVVRETSDAQTIIKTIQEETDALGVG